MPAGTWDLHNQLVALATKKQNGQVEMPGWLGAPAILRLNDAIHKYKQAAMPAKFAGFPPPTTNFTRVPDVVFDHLLADLNGSEFKLLCYIIRHTWGYEKTTDAIALSQFQKGITTMEGRQVDKGVGIAEKTILRCLKTLAAKGVIVITKGQHGHGGAKVNLYSLKMASQPDHEAKSAGGTGKMRVPLKGSGPK